MSLDPPAYVSQVQSNVRARPISWEGAMRAKTISEPDLKKIKAIDKVRKEQRKSTIENDVVSYVTLFFGSGEENPSIFQSAQKRPDIVQYMLVLAGDVIDDSEPFALAVTQHPDPYKPLLPLLKSSSNNIEDPLPLLTSTVLSRIISQVLFKKPKHPETQKALTALFTYLSTLAKSSDSGLQDIAVQEYSAVLRTDKSRKLFWQQRKETLDPLIEILRSAAGAGKDNASTLWSGAASIRSALESGIGGGVGIQLLYHVLLVLWQLSFEGKIIGDGLNEEHDIIPLYIQLIRVSPKEKTTRVLISTLYNLLSTNKTTLLPVAILARLPSILTTLKTRKLTDQDLKEDLASVTEMLDEYQKTQTTFDEYAAELQSGHLRWSPPHRNQSFWTENAKKIIEDDKGVLVKKLAEILGKGWDSDKQVLAVGCNDVACLVRECPEKKGVLEKSGLKGRCLELMQDKEESVRYEALRAVGEWLRYNPK